jgi:hypothetical protein
MGDEKSKGDREEHVAFLAQRDKPETGWVAFKKFLWNKQERKFLGRSGLSWRAFSFLFILAKL